MSSDEEYLDDFISSLMKEESGEGLAPSDEEKEESGSEEGMEPEDLDFAIEDLAPEEFEAGDFALEDFEGEGPELESGLEDSSIDDMMDGLLEDMPEEAALEDILEEPALEDIPEEQALEDIPEELALEDMPEELALEDMPEELALEDIPEELALEDIPEELALEDMPAEEADLEDFSLSDFQMDEMENEDFDDEEESLISPDEVDAMFAAADAAADMGEDLTEEDALFDAEMQTDEIFDFLDDMPTEEEDSGEFGDPAVGGVQETPAEEEQEEKKEKKKKEKKAKKEKKSLFGKKKKSGEGDAEDAGEGDSGSDSQNAEDGAEGEKEEKSQGLFSKIMAFLTEADDEDGEEGRADGLEPSDENKNILKELDDEDKNKKKKKVKAKGDEEGKEKKEKKKKEKKEKKKKEKPAAADAEGSETVKKGKRVSIKSILVIAAFCLTITAMIIVTCSIIPDFFDKRKAREAFYQADYIKSYELMYGKKLDESDAIIYNKAKTILEMKRKLDSYHNYLGMGKEIQALDALMSGVEHYPEILAKAEEYRVTQEVNAIYESILSILNDKYTLAEPVAQTIIAYDDVTYTKRLESIVYNTPFIMPEEKTEEEEAVPTEDILPEEQEMMEEEQLPDAMEQDLPQDTLADEMTTPEEEMPQGEDVSQQEPEGDGTEPSVEEPSAAEAPYVNDSVADSPVQGGNTSQGEDVSTWTGNSGFGSQGEQIQGLQQPINIEIHGN